MEEKYNILNQVATEEIKKLNERIRFLEQCLDNKEKVNKSLREENRKLKEDIDNWFNRETDLRNKRADSLLENKDLRDKIEELEKEIEELNKMMLFETELEK